MFTYQEMLSNADNFDEGNNIDNLFIEAGNLQFLVVIN